MAGAMTQKPIIPKQIPENFQFKKLYFPNKKSNAFLCKKNNFCPASIF